MISHNTRHLGTLMSLRRKHLGKEPALGARPAFFPSPKAGYKCPPISCANRPSPRAEELALRWVCINNLEQFFPTYLLPLPYSVHALDFVWFLLHSRSPSVENVCTNFGFSGKKGLALIKWTPFLLSCNFCLFNLEPLATGPMGQRKRVSLLLHSERGKGFC